MLGTAEEDRYPIGDGVLKMPGEVEGEGGRIKLIEAARTPLNAIVLFALIAEALLITGPIQSDRIPYWAPLLVMVLIIVLFLLTILFRPTSLHLERPKGPTTPIEVQLGFPVGKQPIDLDTDATVMTDRPWKGGRPRGETRRSATSAAAGCRSSRQRPTRPTSSRSS